MAKNMHNMVLTYLHFRILEISHWTWWFINPIGNPSTQQVTWREIGPGAQALSQVAILRHVLGSTKIHFRLNDEAMMWVNSHLSWSQRFGTPVAQLRQHGQKLWVPVRTTLDMKYSKQILQISNTRCSIQQFQKTTHLQFLFFQWPIAHIVMQCLHLQWCLKSHKLPMEKVLLNNGFRSPSSGKPTVSGGLASALW